jgi:hypothetical protein
MQEVEGTVEKKERGLQNAESSLIERAKEGKNPLWPRGCTV